MAARRSASSRWRASFRTAEHQLLLKYEGFEDPFAAMSRAEEIVSGAAEGAFLIGLPHFWQPAR